MGSIIGMIKGDTRSLLQTAFDKKRGFPGLFRPKFLNP